MEGKWPFDLQVDNKKYLHCSESGKKALTKSLCRVNSILLNYLMHLVWN